MGGTRCSFRDCSVSTNRNPRMHFFKFPVRDPKRLKEWIRNCAKEEFLNVSNGKLTNRTVCARHFRVECFMNFKMDRLMPMSTPTLMRINRDLALDFDSLDENGEAMLVKLSPSTLPHLIPPKDFECPLDFNEESLVNKRFMHTYQVSGKRKASAESSPDEKKARTENDLQQEIEQEPNKNIVKDEKQLKKDQEVIIKLEVAQESEKDGLVYQQKKQPKEKITDVIPETSETQSVTDFDSDEEHQPIEISEEQVDQQLQDLIKEAIEQPKIPKENRTDSDSPQIQKNTVDQISKRKMQEQSIYKAWEVFINQEQKQPQNIKKPIEAANDLDHNEDQQNNRETVQQRTVTKKPNDSDPKLTKQMDTQVSINEEHLTVADDSLGSKRENGEDPAPIVEESPPIKGTEEEPTRDQLLLQYNQLKSDFEKISGENAEMRRVHVAVPKNPASSKPTATSLTKPQLYMGIKKYLGPTMAALVRMEMFGGGEDRAWKDDEREFAVELVKLGENVYKYCCDEWRLRLPSLRLARSWLEEKRTDDVDESLDL